MTLVRAVTRNASICLLLLLSLTATALLASHTFILDVSPTGDSSSQLEQFNCTEWNCHPYDGQSLNVAANGTAEIRQSNTACGWSGGYYDSLVRGTPPPLQGTAQGTPINSSLTVLSVQVKFLNRIPSSSSCEEYHLFVSMYFRLPENVSLYCPDDGITESSNYLDTQARVDNVNGLDRPQLSTPTYCGPGVGAWGWSNNTLSLSPGLTGTLTANATTQCQEDETAWGISGKPCTLTGIEIGTEGYGIAALDTNWFNVTYTYQNPQQPNHGCVSCDLASLLLTPLTLYLGILIGGSITAALILTKHKRRPSGFAPVKSIKLRFQIILPSTSPVPWLPYWARLAFLKTT